MGELKEDIEKYLSGELTPAEMHLLEKKALDDPFLAEALEGGSLLRAEEFSKDIKEIEQALEKRVERKVHTIWWWSARVAAGFIILAITGYIMLHLIDEDTTKTKLALNKNENLPRNESLPRQVPSNNIVRDSQAIIIPKSNNIESHSMPAPAQRSEQLIEEKKRMDTVEPEEEIKEEIISQHEPVENQPLSGVLEKDTPSELENDAKQSEMYTRRELKKMQSITSDAPAPSARMKKELKILQGKVIDEKGSPMPGVSVILKGSDTGTVTDIEGNYKLSLGQDNRGELIFSFIGMQNAEIPIGGKDSINAQLSPDFAELSEVVVTSYNPKNDDAAEEVNVYQPATPEGGRKAYRNYVARNLKYPAQAIANKIEGKVSVQFVVDAGGGLNDFKIIKGLGYGCDDEVIRLIKQGPKWLPAKRNTIPMSVKVKVRLKFTLPE